MSSTSSKTDPGSENPGRSDGPGRSERPDRSERSDLPETIAVGRILRAHGLRGEVAVEVLTDVPDRLDPGSPLLLVREGAAPVPLVVAVRRKQGTAAAPRQEAGSEASAGSAGPAGRRAIVLLRFEGIDDRERAGALRGAWLEVERSRVPPAPAGTYYRYELLGCRCLAGGEDLGEVVEVVEDGGGLLLVVSDGSRQVPVPFVARFLRAVDVRSGRIELDLPPGLLEVCASTS